MFAVFTNWTRAEGYSFSISSVESLIAWQIDTTFTYDGKQKQQPVTLIGVINGDVVNAFTEGDTATNAGEYVAKVSGVDNANYTIADTSATWTIDKDNYSLPELLSVDETVAGAADGYIKGLEKGMEIRMEGEGEFTVVTNPDTTFAAGTYEVRMPGGENYNESETVRVVIGSLCMPTCHSTG